MTRHGLFAQTDALQRGRPKGRLARFEKTTALSRENPFLVTATNIEATLVSRFLALLCPPIIADRNRPRPAAKNKTP